MIKYITKSQKSILIKSNNEETRLYDDDCFEKASNGDILLLETEQTQNQTIAQKLLFFINRLALILFRIFFLQEIDDLYKIIDPFVLKTEIKYDEKQEIKYVPSSFAKSGALLSLPKLFVNNEPAKCEASIDYNNIEKEALRIVFDICCVCIYFLVIMGLMLFALKDNIIAFIIIVAITAVITFLFAGSARKVTKQKKVIIENLKNKQ